MSVNKVILLGRLGQDPEIRYTQNGSSVCQFSLATSENWKDRNGEKQEKTEWHRVVVWGKIGELCNQYLSKGRQVYLEGKLQTRQWEDKSGNKRYTTEVNASSVQFIGGNSQDTSDSKPQMNTPQMDKDYSSPEETFTSEDIPF